MNFNNIMIGTDNAPALADFYRRVLGDPTYSDDSYTTWQIGSGVVSVGAHSEVHGKNAEPGRFIWNIESDDVKGDFARMKAAGATVVREPYQLGEGDQTVWIATLADPDGNYFQLASPFPM
jgi:predicted enzyme related to lactoylglutathione lyase